MATIVAPKPRRKRLTVEQEGAEAALARQPEKTAEICKFAPASPGPVYMVSDEALKRRPASYTFGGQNADRTLPINKHAPGVGVYAAEKSKDYLTKSQGIAPFSAADRFWEKRKLYLGHATDHGKLPEETPGPGSYPLPSTLVFSPVNRRKAPIPQYPDPYVTLVPGPGTYEHTEGQKGGPAISFGNGNRDSWKHLYPGYGAKPVFNPDPTPGFKYSRQSDFKDDRKGYTFGGKPTERKLPKTWKRAKDAEEQRLSDWASKQDQGAGRYSREPGVIDPRGRVRRPSEVQLKKLARSKDYSWLRDSQSAASRPVTRDPQATAGGRPRSPSPGFSFGGGDRFSGKVYAPQAPQTENLGPGPVYSVPSGLESGKGLKFARGGKNSPPAHEWQRLRNPGPGHYNVTVDHRHHEDMLFQEFMRIQAEQTAAQQQASEAQEALNAEADEATPREPKEQSAINSAPKPLAGTSGAENVGAKSSESRQSTQGTRAAAGQVGDPQAVKNQPFDALSDSLNGTVLIQAADNAGRPTTANSSTAERSANTTTHRPKTSAAIPPRQTYPRSRSASPTANAKRPLSPSKASTVLMQSMRSLTLDASTVWRSGAQSAAGALTGPHAVMATTSPMAKSVRQQWGKSLQSAMTRVSADYSRFGDRPHHIKAGGTKIGNSTRDQDRKLYAGPTGTSTEAFGQESPGPVYAPNPALWASSKKYTFGGGSTNRMAPVQQAAQATATESIVVPDYTGQRVQNGKIRNSGAAMFGKSSTSRDAVMKMHIPEAEHLLFGRFSPGPNLGQFSTLSQRKTKFSDTKRDVNPISREALGVPGPGAYSYTKPYQKIKIIEDNPDDWAD